MFFTKLKKKNESLYRAEVPAAPTPPAGIVPTIGVSAEETRSYRELAGTLGFCPDEMIHRRILEVCALNDIKVYDYTKVCDWLTQKRKEAKADFWCWRPLRDTDDVSAMYGWGDVNKDASAGKPGRFQYAQYPRLVPAHALKKVELFTKEFGSSVVFYVSDFASANPDPFLLVKPRSGKYAAQVYITIIDCWDEPGF